MEYKRRDFIRLLTTGLIGSIVTAELDLDKLLWVPGQKKIFIPEPIVHTDIVYKLVTTSEIITMEIERIIPKIQPLFERNDLFYSLINE